MATVAHSDEAQPSRRAMTRRTRASARDLLVHMHGHVLLPTARGSVNSAGTGHDMSRSARRRKNNTRPLCGLRIDSDRDHQLAPRSTHSGPLSKNTISRGIWRTLPMGDKCPPKPCLIAQKHRGSDPPPLRRGQDMGHAGARCPRNKISLARHRRKHHVSYRTRYRW